MNDLTTALEAEQRRIREQLHALHIRDAHVASALLRARQGEHEKVVRALLESKNIVILCQPVAAGT